MAFEGLKESFDLDSSTSVPLFLRVFRCLLVLLLEVLLDNLVYPGGVRCGNDLRAFASNGARLPGAMVDSALAATGHSSAFRALARATSLLAHVCQRRKDTLIENPSQGSIKVRHHLL